MHDPYDVYVMYLSMMNHFRGDGYDYFKYNGKIRTSKDSFLQRNDRYFFEKLARQPNPRDWLLANLVGKSKFWIGDNDAQQVYDVWVSHIEGLAYRYETDLRNLDDLDEALKVEDGRHPILLRLLLQKKVCIETLIILNELVNFVPYWNKRLARDPVWDKYSFLMRKYKPFLEVDINRYKQITLKVFA